MREERGVVALLTVAFLTLLGIFAIAFVLAAAKINNAYTLLNNAAQSAAFSAITSTTVSEGKVLIPCSDEILIIRETPSGCNSGDAYRAAEELLQATFANNPSGFCFRNCEEGQSPVALGEEGSSWVQVFNTDGSGDETNCTESSFESSSIDAILVENSEPPLFSCWVARQSADQTPYSLRFSSGVVVRLESEIDLLLFGDRKVTVYAGAAIDQGE
jgi:hypothetical protein